MAKITATYEDGRELTWEDGAVAGNPLLLRLLGPMAKLVGMGQAMPEGPLVDLTEYESEPTAFVALVSVARPGAAPRFSYDGEFVLAMPPPEDAN